MLILIPRIALAQAAADDGYDEGKGCYRELVRQRAGADEGKWRKCIAFFDVYYEKNRDGGKASAALFSAARLKQEHYAIRGEKADLEHSVKDFNELIRRYPDSPLADDALYRIGCMRQDAMDQPERARKAFEHVVTKYPAGDMAVRAKARLAKFGPEPEGETVAAAATAETAPTAQADVTPEAPAAPVATETTAETTGIAEKGLAVAPSGNFEETDVNATVKEEDAPVVSGGTADAFDRATLVNVDVSDTSHGTTIALALDRDVEHSVEFTELGPRTGSPPELDLILLHTKSSKGLLRERLLESKYVDSYKVKHLILSSGIKVSFKLRPDAGYDVKKTVGGLVVNFGPQNVATRAIETAEIDGVKGSTAPRLSDFRVVIDPGHGGEEDGAIGAGGTKEKDVTLAIAKDLASELRRKLGAKVYLTRTSDKTLTLDQRSAFAVSKKADLFISIHANASKDRGVSGIETYYLNNATDEAAARLAKLENKSTARNLSEVEHIISTMLQNYDAAESVDLAGEVQERLAKRINRSHGKVKDRGVRSAMFYVLVGAKCPAILVETAFISNPKEEKLLEDEKYQRSVADAISDGVKGYLKLREKSLVSL